MVRGRGRKGGVEEFGVLEEACPAAGVAEGADEEEDGVGDEEHGVVEEVGDLEKHGAEVAMAVELGDGGECFAQALDGAVCEFVEMVGLGAELVGLGAVHGGDDSARGVGREFPYGYKKTLAEPWF